MIENQRLLKFEENGYWYTINRGPSGNGYLINGYYNDKTGKTTVPQFCMPYTQEEVAKDFAANGREWRWE